MKVGRVLQSEGTLTYCPVGDEAVVADLVKSLSRKGFIPRRAVVVAVVTDNSGPYKTVTLNWKVQV